MFSQWWLGGDLGEPPLLSRLPPLEAYGKQCPTSETRLEAEAHLQGLASNLLPKKHKPSLQLHNLQSEGRCFRKGWFQAARPLGHMFSWFPEQGATVQQPWPASHPSP